MHPKIALALEEIDAAVFNGDVFEDPAARAKFFDYISAWLKEFGLLSLKAAEEEG